MIEEFKKILKESIQSLPYQFSVVIKDNMNKGIGTNAEFSKIAPNNTNKLDVGKGDLLRSFIPNKDGNISKFEEKGDSFTLEYGSDLPYAAIHDTGGFIKSKGNMPKFFWAVYYKTQNPYYKNMALGVKKRGGVNIPKRPYFTNSQEKFEKIFNQSIETALLKFAKHFETVNNEI